jgi:predicted DNA-binding protein YlxM (UPF0122 family)
LQITEERRKRVIDLYFNQHKSYAEISQIEHISPRDIHTIVKEEEARRQKYQHQQQLVETSSRVYKLFSEGKRPVEVAITLNLREPTSAKLYREYWKLKRMHILNLIYKETNGKLWIVLKLYNQLIKKRHMSIQQVVNAVDTAIHKLPYMESLYKQAKDEVENLHRIRQGLINDIEAFKYKISLLDKTAFSCVQESRRTEQQVQELIDKKDRIEKRIADILNGEGYSKIKHIVKENVKALLSENKILISASFAAIIQTLKADPEIAHVIHNVSATPDDRGHDNNNDNNIIKYLELNKTRILDLSEKNYENVVEALTNDSIASLLYNLTVKIMILACI